MQRPDLLNNIFIFLLGTLGSKVILFFLVPLYTNVLTPEEYGLAEMIFTLVQLITPIVSIAIYNGELRYGLSLRYNKDEIAKCTMVVILFSALECIIIIPILSSFELLTKWKIYIAAYAFSLICFNVALIFLKINNQNKEYSIFSIIQTITLGILNFFFLLYLRFNIKGYLISSILSFFTVAVSAFLYSGYIKRALRAKLNVRLLKKMLYFSLPFIINDISWWIIHASDKYMIAYFLNIGILGLYTTAAKIPSLVNSISAIFTQAWTISAIHEQETRNDKEYYSYVFENFILTLYTIVLISNSIIKYFMVCYVGSDFVSSWSYVPILLVSSSFGAVASYANSIYSALEKSKLIMLLTLLSASCNIILNYLLICRIGVWGAILSTLVSYTILMATSLEGIQRYTDRKLNLNKFYRITFLVTLQAVCVTVDYHSMIISIMILGLLIIFNKNKYIRIFKHIMSKLHVIK